MCSLETLRALTTASSSWGPALRKHRELREHGPTVLTSPSDLDLTIDTIDYKVPYQFSNSAFAQSMSSMHSTKTEVSFESYV